MKYLIGLLLCLVFQPSYAKQSLPKNCSHLEGATKANFVLFSKTEFIQLGECLAISFIKKKVQLNFVESCNEVDEDRRNLLGIFSLSKYEAILIGQCKGIIDYIYQHYDNEPVNSNSNRSYSQALYHCTKGIEAVDRIRQSSTTLTTRTDLRNLLCTKS